MSVVWCLDLNATSLGSRNSISLLVTLFHNHEPRNVQLARPSSSRLNGPRARHDLEKTRKRDGVKLTLLVTVFGRPVVSSPKSGGLHQERSAPPLTKAAW
jgi:hypothetical protein